MDSVHDFSAYTMSEPWIVIAAILVVFGLAMMKLLLWHSHRNNHHCPPVGVGMTDILPHKVWCANKEGRIIYSNQKWKKFSGTGDAWTHYIHIEDMNHFFGQWTRCLETHGGLSVELRMRNAKGIYKWFSVQAEYHPHMQLQVFRECCEEGLWVGSLINIDSGKQAHHQVVHELGGRLDDVENKCQEIIKTAVDPIIIANAEGKILSFNDAAYKMFLYTEEEIVGQNLSKLMDPSKLLSIYKFSMLSITRCKLCEL